MDLRSFHAGIPHFVADICNQDPVEVNDAREKG